MQDIDEIFDEFHCDGDYRSNEDNLEYMNTSESIKIDGRRIINFEKFHERLRQLDSHDLQKGCRFSDCIIVKERQRGFSSDITYKCKNCGKLLVISTNESVNNMKNCEMTTNYLAVLSTLFVGIGFSQLEEIFTTMDIPIMSTKHYQKLQEKIEKSLIEVAATVMKDAAEEEGKSISICLVTFITNLLFTSIAPFRTVLNN